MLDPVGTVIVNKEFVATTLWPPKDTIFAGTGMLLIDKEKEYKKALAGNLVTVMEIGVDGSYMVLGKSDNPHIGQFLWVIEKEDTRAFVPIIKKNGVVMPAGLSPFEEMFWQHKDIMGVVGDVGSMINDFFKKQSNGQNSTR